MVCRHIQFNVYTWRNLTAVAGIAMEAKTFSHIVVAPARCSIVTCCFSRNRTNVKFSKVTTISRVVYREYANFINVIIRICYQNSNNSFILFRFKFGRAIAKMLYLPSASIDTVVVGSVVVPSSEY